MDEIHRELKHDKKLEKEAVDAGQYKPHRLITSIQSKLGLANFLRNTQNRKKVDIESVDQ